MKLETFEVILMYRIKNIMIYVTYKKPDTLYDLKVMYLI